MFCDDSTAFVQHDRIDGRLIALGFLLDGRMVVSPFEYDVDLRWVRVVTPYEPTADRWWTEYERAIRKRL